MPTAWKPCSRPGCPELVPPGRSRCDADQAAADARRGSSTQRGYGVRHRRQFRAGVLARDPLCVCTSAGHGHGARCLTAATVADHYPRDRRELVAVGLNPDDPRHGRGLCANCHNHHTAQAQPGGWNAR